MRWLLPAMLSRGMAWGTVEAWRRNAYPSFQKFKSLACCASVRGGGFISMCQSFLSFWQIFLARNTGKISVLTDWGMAGVRLWAEDIDCVVPCLSLVDASKDV